MATQDTNFEPNGNKVGLISRFQKSEIGNKLAYLSNLLGTKLCYKELSPEELRTDKSNYKDFQAVILLHSIRWGRLSLTDVADSQYDILLKNLENDGVAVSVIVCDIDERKTTKEEQMDRLKESQGTVVRIAGNIILCGELKKMDKEDKHDLKKFIAKSRKSADKDLLSRTSPSIDSFSTVNRGIYPNYGNADKDSLPRSRKTSMFYSGGNTAIHPNPGDADKDSLPRSWETSMFFTDFRPNSGDGKKDFPSGSSPSSDNFTTGIIDSRPNSGAGKKVFPSGSSPSSDSFTSGITDSHPTSGAGSSPSSDSFTTGITESRPTSGAETKETPERSSSRQSLSSLWRSCVIV